MGAAERHPPLEQDVEQRVIGGDSQQHGESEPQPCARRRQQADAAQLQQLPEIVPDDRRIHLRCALVAIVKGDRHFSHPQVDLGGRQQFETDLEAADLAAEAGQPLPTHGEETGHRVADIGKQPGGHGRQLRRDLPRQRPSRDRPAFDVAAADRHIVAVGKERRDQVGNGLRRMAEIGIHHHHVFTCGGPGPGHDRSGQPVIKFAPHQTDGIVCLPRHDLVTCAVSRLVIDKDDLEIDGVHVTDFEYPLQQRIDIAGFVQGGDDDGDNGHAQPGSSGYGALRHRPK